MTAAAPAGQRVPDAAAVLRRASTRLNQAAGDGVLTDDQLADLTSAVQQQIVDPLTAAAGIDGVARLAELESQLEQVRGDLAEAEGAANGWKELAERWDRDHTNIVLPYTSRLEQERAVLWALAKRIARKMIDERSSMDDQRHKHYYPAEHPGELPGPCPCGHPYPRAHIVDRSHETDTEPDAWGRFFAGLRDELAEWNPKGHKR